MLSTNRPPFRIYAGYTGWTTAQLRSEVANGLWTVLRPIPAPHSICTPKRFGDGNRTTRATIGKEQIQ